MKQRKIFGMIVTIVALGIYANTMDHGYVLDDEDAIVRNSFVQQGLGGLGEIWTSEYRAGFSDENGSLYRPLTLTLFALESELWPNDAGMAHRINILLYALCVLVLFLFLTALFRDQDLWLPLFVSLLFVVHPMHTEVVANIKSADEILSLLFGLMGLFFVLKYIDTRHIKWSLFTSVVFALALMSKESAIMLFPMIPIMVLMFRRTTVKSALLTTLPVVFSIAAYLFLRQNALGGLLGTEELPILDNMLVGAEGMDRFTTAFAIIGMYIAKLIFPESLSHDYSIHQIEIVGFGDLAFLFGFGAFLVSGYLAYRYWKSQPIPVFAILFFWITFSLYSNLIILIGTHMGDRLMFLPSLGFCTAVGWIFWKLSTRNSDSIQIRKAGVPVVLFAFVLLMLMVKTMNRSMEWKDELTLYSADVLNAPNSTRTHYRLGRTLNKLAKSESHAPTKHEYLQKAVEHLNRSIDIYPEFADAYGELGLSYQNLGDYGKAMLNNELALELNPNHVSTLNNIGAVYFLQGKPAEAIVYFEKALEVNPNYIESIGNMGSSYGALERYSEALPWFKKAADLDPTNARYLFFVALTYQNLGDVNASESWLSRARAIDPNIGR